jgi:hypothetical protein
MNLLIKVLREICGGKLFKKEHATTKLAAYKELQVTVRLLIIVAAVLCAFVGTILLVTYPITFIG